MPYGDKKLEAGYAASHPPQPKATVYISPATGNEKNVIMRQPRPEACWKLDDGRFDFDSCFVRPEATAELAELAALRAAHPGCPMSLFGHADPTGDETYNKSLSGRRAEVIYAILLRDPAPWEKFFTAAPAGKTWGLRETQMMLTALGFDTGGTSGSASATSTDAIKQFQQSKGLTADGSPGTNTRKALIPDYMAYLWPTACAKSDFLNKGADSGGKGDIQGCSEFNPTMVFSISENTTLQQPANHAQRNERNSVNRRVLIYLFPKGSTMPSDWPCPRVSEGASACKGRFWSDGDKRRNPQANPRTFDQSGDTFACRFYHRLAEVSPCERPGGTTPQGSILVKWKPEKALCGDEVELTVETSLPIDTVHVEFTSTLVDANSPPDPIDIALSDGKGSWKWKVKNIGFQKNDDSFLEFEELKATATGGGGSAEAKLRVDGLIKGDKQTFSAHRDWSGFTMDPKWDQKIENFKNLLTVSFKARKAWGATKINLTGFVNGKAGGCPENGHRWGRALNLNQMQPDQYYNGNAWVALPAGFVPGATNYFGATFTKSGTKFVARYGGTWPEAFADYDFNDAKYVKKRADWCQKAHDVWTDALMIKRKECKSDDGVRCCLYDTDLTMTITEVTTSGDDVIYMAPGGWRSDAGNFAFDDPDLKMAAHEAGHHLDNPDEYAGGAVDPTINTDGAVAGIDATTIMNSTELVKVRHYHGIVQMTKRIIKKKYGKDYVYEAID